MSEWLHPLSRGWLQVAMSPRIHLKPFARPARWVLSSECLMWGMRVRHGRPDPYRLGKVHDSAAPWGFWPDTRFTEKSPNKGAKQQTPKHSVSSRKNLNGNTCSERHIIITAGKIKTHHNRTNVIQNKLGGFHKGCQVTSGVSQARGHHQKRWQKLRNKIMLNTDLSFFNACYIGSYWHAFKKTLKWPSSLCRVLLLLWFLLVTKKSVIRYKHNRATSFRKYRPNSWAIKRKFREWGA